MWLSENNSLSDKKRATFNRQRCINLLEKITKNMFRMFRDKESTKKQIFERFSFLKEKLDELWDVYLDSEYHREMRMYIEQLVAILSSDISLDSLREEHMTRLNRLQKLKNAVTYKRKKVSKKVRHTDYPQM